MANDAATFDETIELLTAHLNDELSKVKGIGKCRIFCLPANAAKPIEHHVCYLPAPSVSVRKPCYDYVAFIEAIKDSYLRKNEDLSKPEVTFDKIGEIRSAFQKC